MRRLFKQLEFLFAGQAHRLPIKGGTRSLSAFTISAAPPSDLASSSERPIHLNRRNSALESQARKLLRVVGANKLARGIRVEWNPRLKTCAGRADYRHKLVSLNPLLLDLADDAPKLKSTRQELECLQPSSLTTKPLAQDSVHKLECNMHSSSASAVHSVTSEAGPRRVINKEIDRTLRHELAHLLAQFRVGRRRIRPHGYEWRQACRDLGIAGEARCHNLPFATKAYARRYVYRCPNCKQKFPRVRRIRRAIACLACCCAYNRGEFDSRFRLRLIKRTDVSS